MEWSTLLPVAAGGTVALVGTFIGHWLERRSEARRYERTRADAFREQRGLVYRAFLRQCHTAAHQIGRVADGIAYNMSQDRGEAMAFLDREVTATYRELEVVGSDSVVKAATDTLARLRAFRSRVLPETDPASGDQAPVRYWSTEYLEAYEPYAASRTALIQAIRAELHQSGPASN